MHKVQVKEQSNEGTISCIVNLLPPSRGTRGPLTMTQCNLLLKYFWVHYFQLLLVYACT